MNVTVRKIGNSEGVILPKEVLERHNLRAGDTLVLTEDGNELRLSPAQDDPEEFERKIDIPGEDVCDTLREYIQTYERPNAAAVTGPTHAATTSAWKATTTSSRRPTAPAISMSAATAGAEVNVTASTLRSAMRSTRRNTGVGSAAPSTR